MYMYDLIDVKEYTDTEFDQVQGSLDCSVCPHSGHQSIRTSKIPLKSSKSREHLLIGTKMVFYLTENCSLVF